MSVFNKLVNRLLAILEIEKIPADTFDCFGETRRQTKLYILYENCKQHINKERQ